MGGTDDNSRRHVDWQAQNSSRGFAAASAGSKPPSLSALQQHMTRGYQGDALDSFTGKTQRDVVYERKKAAFKEKQAGKQAYGHQGAISMAKSDIPHVPISHSSVPAGGPRVGRRGSTSHSREAAQVALPEQPPTSCMGGGDGFSAGNFSAGDAGYGSRR